MCHKRTPSIDVTVKDCRAFYAASVADPRAEEYQACSQCDCGRTAFFTSKSKEGKKMATNKPCSRGDGKASVKEGLCSKCYREKYGRPAYGPGSDQDPKPKKSEKQAVSAKKSSLKALGALKASAGAGNGGKGASKAALSPEKGLLVNFKAYPAVLARLETVAKQEHRTPELQILHILDTKFTVEDVMAADRPKK